MKDRIPLYPGRVKLNPVAGEANTYDMVRADQPTQEGTALNKANLLSDETAALFGLDGTAVPNDALSTLSKSALRNDIEVQTAKLFEDWETFEIPSEFKSMGFVKKTNGKLYGSAFDGSNTYLISYDGEILEKLCQLDGGMVNITEYAGILYLIESAQLSGDSYSHNYLFKSVDGGKTIERLYQITDGRYDYCDNQALEAVNGNVIGSYYNSDNRYRYVFSYEIESGKMIYTGTDWSQGKGIPVGGNIVYKGGKYYFGWRVWQEPSYIAEWDGTSTAPKTMTFTLSGFPSEYRIGGPLYSIGGKCYGTVLQNSVIYGFAELDINAKTATYLSHDFYSKFSTGLSDGINVIEYKNAYYVILADGTIVKNAAKDMKYWEKVFKTDVTSAVMFENIGEKFIGMNTGKNHIYISEDKFITKTFLTDLFGGKIGIPAEQIIDNVHIETGSYAGTGTYGESNPNSLTFDFEPKIVFLRQRVSDTISSKILSVLTYGNSSTYNVEGTSSHYYITVNWNGKTVSWYSNQESSYQMNGSKTTYSYVAIG